MLSLMIEKTEDNGVVTLRLAHGKASALDIELVEALARAVAEVTASDARAVLLTGSGSIFSAGVDLYRLVGKPDQPLAEAAAREYARRFVPALSRMLLELFSMPRPLVVALNGHAIAGGCIIALTGDYRLMASGGGRIGIPEMLVGVPFPPSVIEIVRFAVAPQHLQTLMYGGRTIPAEDAQRIGLIDEVVAPDALEARGLEMARHFATLSPRNFELCKRQLRDATLDRAKHFANELDAEVLELWGDPVRHQAIREYLARTVRR